MRLTVSIVSVNGWYRKRKMDMEQQMLAWRILHDDIDFVGSAAAASAGSSNV